MVAAAKFSKAEIKVLEAAMKCSTYQLAATEIGMAPSTFYYHIKQAKAKIKNAKRFLFQARKYEKILFGEKEEWEEE